ncbi:MAG: AAA family ATPase, partial [Myxococcaceae bacterium]
VAEYAVRLAQATRRHPELERGASTRAVLALTSAARAHALWEARDFVTPGDVRAVWVPCMAHRLMWRQAPSGTSARDEAAHLLEELARTVPAPR